MIYQSVVDGVVWFLSENQLTNETYNIGYVFDSEGFNHVKIEHFNENGSVYDVYEIPNRFCGKVIRSYLKDASHQLQYWKGSHLHNEGNENEGC